MEPATTSWARDGIHKHWLYVISQSFLTDSINDILAQHEAEAPA